MLEAKPHASTQRQEAVRELLELIDSYPEDKPVEVSYDDDKRAIDTNSMSKLLCEKDIKAIFKENIVHVDKKVAAELAELEGHKYNGSTLYIYIKLFESETVEALFKHPVS